MKSYNLRESCSRQVEGRITLEPGERNSETSDVISGFLYLMFSVKYGYMLDNLLLPW